ncbi:MAG: DUF4131 domain-containing protein, partial [Pseudomonadota bacterium]
MSDAVFARFATDNSATSGRTPGEIDDPTSGVSRSAAARHWSTGPIDALTAVLEHERARWILWTPIAFALGAATYFGLRFEPGLALCGAVFTASLACLAGMRRSATIPYVACGVLALAALGFLAAKLRTETVRAPVILTDTTEIKVSGYAEAIEPRAKGGSRITILLTALAATARHNQPRRVRVSSRQKLDQIRVGDHIDAWVRLRPPAAPAAPGDY